MQHENISLFIITSIHGGPIKSSWLEIFTENDFARKNTVTQRKCWVPAHAPFEVIFGLSCLYAYSYPNHKYLSTHNWAEYFGYYYG